MRVCVCVELRHTGCLAGEDGVVDNYEYNYPCRCSALFVFYEKVSVSHRPRTQLRRPLQGGRLLRD